MSHFRNTSSFLLLQVLRFVAFRCSVYILLALKYMLMTSVFLFDLPGDLKSCLFILLFVTEDKPYNGTFVKTTRYHLLKMVIHIFNGTLFWPLIFNFNVPIEASVCIYIAFNLLELLPKGCAFPNDDTRKDTTLGNHDITPVIGYIVTRYGLVSQDNYAVINSILYTCMNTFVHDLLMPILSKNILDVYSSVKNDTVLRHNFLRQYTKMKICSYVIILLLKCFCIVAIAPIISYILWLELQFFHGFHKYDFLNESSFSDRTVIHYKQSYYAPFQKAEMLIEDATFTHQKMLEYSNRMQKCSINKVVYLENALLYVNIQRSIKKTNTSYFWSLDGRRIDISNSKYEYFINKTAAETNHMLILSKVNEKDFGTYSLMMESWFKTSHCCNEHAYSRNINVEHHFTITTKTLACVFLQEQSNYIKIYGTIGEIVSLNNLKLIRKYTKLEKIYNFKTYHIREVENIYKCLCNPTVNLFYSNGQTEDVRPIAGDWFELTFNISFCICPSAYTRAKTSIRLMYIDDIIYSPYLMTIEPFPIYFFDKIYAKNFTECEKLGYKISEFASCLYDLPFGWTTFIENTSKQFDLQNTSEFLSIIASLFFVVYVVKIINEDLDRLLFRIFHRKAFNKSRQSSFTRLHDFDVYISYNDESKDDKCFAEDTIKPFLTDNLNYNICDCESISYGQNRRKRFEELVVKCKTLIILLSDCYLSSEICMVLEYELTLLALLGASRILKDNILIIKTATCSQDALPMACFTVIDWSNTVTNIRNEDEKKTELQEWLSKRIKRPGQLKLFILNSIFYPMFRKIERIIHNI